MKSLKIGSKFTLPADLATQTLSILGKRGVGKTHCAVVIVEELIKAGLQVVVIDPLDVWHGLRSSNDGKHEGLPVVIIGGEHADIPLTETSADILADFVVEKLLSVVIVTRHMSKSSQRQFVAAFCERLYRRKGEGKHRTPLHLVLDEADEWCPQRLSHDTARVFGAVDTIVRRGRSSGIGVTLISQRSAAINKDCLTQTEVLVCFRTISPQDRTAVEAWIESHDAQDQRETFMQSLASLEIGTAWFWSPGWLDCFEKVKVRNRETFDSSATPKIGETVKAPKKLAEVDIEGLKASLSSVIEAKKADDPKELKRKLERNVADIMELCAIASTAGWIAEGKGYEDVRSAIKFISARIADIKQCIKVAHKHGWNGVENSKILSEFLDEALREKKQKPTKPISADEIRTIDLYLTELQQTRTVVEQWYARLKQITGVEPKAPVQAIPKRVAVEVPREVPKSIPKVSKDDCLPVGEKATLSALIQYPNGLEREQLTVLTGYKRSSRNAYLSRLMARGYAESSGNRVTATDSGRAALPDAQPLPTGKELQEFWLNRLPDGERRILEVLIEAYPSTVTRESIDERTGYMRSSRNAYLSRLAAKELVEQRGSDVKAADELFQD